MKIDKLTEYIELKVTKRIEKIMKDKESMETEYIPFIINIDKNKENITITFGRCMSDGTLASEWIKNKVLDIVASWNSDRNQILDVEKECKR